MAYEGLWTRAVEAVRGNEGRKQGDLEIDNAIGFEESLCRDEGNR